jgi:acetate kinase
MVRMLYSESGLLGISGISRDMREIEEAAGSGNPRAALALSAFCYKVKRSIGSMMIVLGGCDVLAFAGGIGLNSSTVRSKSLEGTAGLGFVLDETKNTSTEKPNAENPVMEISAASSGVRILIVRTFEELMMARQCLKVVESEQRA